MNKGFATLLILIAIPLIVATAFYLKSLNKSREITEPISHTTPSPDPYFGWKKYENKTYKFSIRYPKDWFVKEYQDYAANFYDTDPKEATPGATKVRFLKAQEKQDLSEFEKIQKTESGKEIREPLDVKSTITKIRNLDISDYSAVEYEINRHFTALEGPTTEYHHMYEIKKEDIILEFTSNATTKEEQQKVDEIFKKIISSLKFSN